MYDSSSLYYRTKLKNNQYLDILKVRPIPAQPDDILYKVLPQYTHRPDLLAYDLYNDRKLWWVFAQRNMDVLYDPVYDLVAGIEIYLPKGSNLRVALGNN